MHLHFVFPRWRKLLEDQPSLKGIFPGQEVGSFRMAGLGLATAAGAVPPGHQISCTDEHVDELDFSLRPDLICLSFFTPQATRAYEIADRFREQGVSVIAGGIHPTMMPEEALRHCDSVVCGPVEGLWDQVLTDHGEKNLKSKYIGNSQADFAEPTHELFRSSPYLRTGVVQIARGCTYACPFCVIPSHAGHTITYKPVEDVIRDIRGLPYPSFFFGDENLLFADEKNCTYTERLLQRMKEERLLYPSFTANYPDFVSRLSDERIQLLADSKIKQIYLVMGLRHPLKTELRDESLFRIIRLLKELGIEVLASFTLGHDLDDEPVEERIEEYCSETGTNLAEFTITTPFPGTRTFNNMQKQNRILHHQWEKYNGAHAVFQPLHESPEQLESRYLSMWKWFYSSMTQEEVQLRFVKGFGGNILRGRSPSVLK